MQHFDNVMADWAALMACFDEESICLVRHYDNEYDCDYDYLSLLKVPTRMKMLQVTLHSDNHVKRQ